MLLRKVQQAMTTDVEPQEYDGMFRLNASRLPRTDYPSIQPGMDIATKSHAAAPICLADKNIVIPLKSIVAFCKEARLPPFIVYFQICGQPRSAGEGSAHWNHTCPWDYRD